MLLFLQLSQDLNCILQCTSTVEAHVVSPWWSFPCPCSVWKGSVTEPWPKQTSPWAPGSNAQTSRNCQHWKRKRDQSCALSVTSVHHLPIISFASESLRTAVFASLYTGEELGWKVNTAASTPLTRSTGCIKWLPFFSLHTGQWSKEDSYSQRLKSKYLNAGVPLERNIVLNKCPILRLPEIIDIC